MSCFVQRQFADAGVAEALAFLAVSHPRGGAQSLWSGLSDFVLQDIATFLLEPLVKTFVPSHEEPLSPRVSRDPLSASRLLFGNRTLQAVARPRIEIVSILEHVFVCGPRMEPATGIYEIDFLVTDIVSVDGFCRVDIGVAIEPICDQRTASGVRWEAGDGDVFIASDVGGVGGKGEAGWLCDASRVTEGALPRWDHDGSKPGLVVDTYKNRLGFKMNGIVLPLELPLPKDVSFHFVVSWTTGTGGTYTIKSVCRSVIDTLSPPGRLLTSAYAAPEIATRDLARYKHPQGIHAFTPALVAALVDAVSPEVGESEDMVTVLAQRFPSGTFLSSFVAEVVKSAVLPSAKQNAAIALAAHVQDPKNFIEVVVDTNKSFMTSTVQSAIHAKLKLCCESQTSRERPLGSAIKCKPSVSLCGLRCGLLLLVTSGIIVHQLRRNWQRVSR